MGWGEFVMNPLVQRALQSRFQTAQPNTSLEQANQKVAYGEQMKQFQAIPQQGAWSGAANSGAGGSPTVGGDQIDRILRTIRNRESGGNYTAKNPVSSASGAYQFINSTWRGLGGQGTAASATPQEQDRIARAYVQRLLNQHGGNLEAVPASWYTGSYKGKGNLNYNPGGPGNPLTVQQYVDKWLADYNKYG